MTSDPNNLSAPDFRIGQGYDLHRLEPGRKLILAGVDIPFAKGLAGHSDADVLYHAVIDALLGAAGLDDIGTQFPDSDPAYRGIDSGLLLTRTMTLIRNARFAPVNADVTVIAEKPALRDYKKQMRTHLAEKLGLPFDAVAVKAKTNESLGHLGRNEAIACLAVVLLKRSH